jgi:hypothetical protein
MIGQKNRNASIPVVVVRSVLLVAGVNVNTDPIVYFGFGGRQSDQSERRQTQEEISFQYRFSCLEGRESPFTLGLGLDQVTS